MAVKRKTDSVKFPDLGVSQQELLRYYNDMLLIRRFEERARIVLGYVKPEERVIIVQPQ